MVAACPPAESRFRFHVVGVILGLAIAAGSAGADDEPAAEKSEPRAAGPRTVEARFTDASSLRLRLSDEQIKVASPYGELTIPVAEICRIEFATRVTDEVSRRIDAAIAKLSSDQSAERDAAGAELVKLREKAYPALARLTDHEDRETARRAETIIKKLRETVPAEDLRVREHDVVHTAHSKISGHIHGDVLKAHTSQFGEVEMKLADLRAIHVRGAQRPVRPADIAHGPGNLLGFNNQIGASFVFQVTGAGGGIVYGTDVYTTDSQLAVAAVHAGVLKPGQTGLVRVNIVPSPVQFASTTRNGITSYNWGQYPAAYEVKAVTAEDDAPGCGAEPAPLNVVQPAPEFPGAFGAFPPGAGFAPAPGGGIILEEGGAFEVFPSSPRRLGLFSDSVGRILIRSTHESPAGVRRNLGPHQAPPSPANSST